MPVSQENEAVLKGRVAPKKPKAADEMQDAEEEEKDDGRAKKPVRPEDVAMGVEGDVER